MNEHPEILIFNPTQAEHDSTLQYLAQAEFKHFTPRAIITGPGKINAAVSAVKELVSLIASGSKPLAIVGAGTAGSLSYELKSGDIIVSASALIADWIMQDNDVYAYANYGELNYAAMTESLPEQISITCKDEFVNELISRLSKHGFKRGRLMTSDIFVAGMENKLNRGKDFQCLACDMESGVFGYIANTKFGGLPWFNVRVVADTLDHGFDDYAEMEVDMTDILGRNLLEVLKEFDKLLQG